jgi:hypothetical protein
MGNSFYAQTYYYRTHSDGRRPIGVLPCKRGGYMVGYYDFSGIARRVQHALVPVTANAALLQTMLDSMADICRLDRCPDPAPDNGPAKQGHEVCYTRVATATA